jgi:hypothetical protein
MLFDPQLLFFGLGRIPENGVRLGENHVGRPFESDVLSCPRCGGRMRILAAINAPDAIQKILACLGLPTRAPPIAPQLSDTETGDSW